MKERPMLFSTPMVQGILENRKTMTRRIIKPHPLIDDNNQIGSSNGIPAINDYGSCSVIKCPYGKIGDVLWVREKWQHTKCLNINPEDENYGYVYKADNQPWDNIEHWTWRPSIHMPKEAARIWLKITNIQPQRLHDITDTEIIAEGIRIPVNGIGTGRVLLALGDDNTAIHFLPKGCLDPDGPKITQSQLLHAFWAELWCKINGRASYDSNPWVWAISFDVLSTTGKPSDL